MSLDFRASQVQLNKIISSGSTGTGASILVYPITAQDATTPNQGVLSSSAFWTGSIGTDVFMFVSGSVSTRTVGGTHGTSVFGGDLVVSGNFNVVGTTNIVAAGAQWIEVGPSPKLATTASVAIGITSSALYGGSEGIFFVSGTKDINLDGTGKYAIFGGTVRISGGLVVGDNISTTPGVAVVGGVIAFTAIAGTEGTGVGQLALGPDSNAGALNINAYSPGQNSVAFTGSSMFISAGYGGNCVGGTGAGGIGGTLFVRAGDGGGAGSAGSGGIAGAISFTAGVGGPSKVATGGAGGSTTMVAGTGGTGSTGGVGGAVTITAGTGGSGSTAGGSGGSITINVGRSGSAGGSNGNIFIGGTVPAKIGLGVSAVANTDTFFYISGGVNPVGSSAGMSVFQGDVLVSGSLIAQQAVTGVLVSTTPVSVVLSDRWDTLEISGAHANQLLVSGSNTISGHRSWEIILGTPTSGSLLFIPPSAGAVTASVNNVTTASYPFPGGTMGAVQIWTITQISSSTVGALTGSTLRYYIS